MSGCRHFEKSRFCNPKASEYRQSPDDICVATAFSNYGFKLRFSVLFPCISHGGTQKGHLVQSTENDLNTSKLIYDREHTYYI
jgi:hypothetical protein